MKKIVLFCALMLAVVCLPLTAGAAQGTNVEILYMNHGPLMSTIKDIKTVLAGYGNKVNASWYDFDTPEGENFMARKGIRQHVPLVIWIDGKSSFPLKGKEINFTGFPSGSGPAFFQGKWTMADLRKALDQATRKK